MSPARLAEFAQQLGLGSEERPAAVEQASPRVQRGSPRVQRGSPRVQRGSQQTAPRRRRVTEAPVEGPTADAGAATVAVPLGAWWAPQVQRWAWRVPEQAFRACVMDRAAPRADARIASSR